MTGILGGLIGSARRSVAPTSLTFVASGSLQEVDGIFQVPVSAQAGDLLVLATIAASTSGTLTGVIPSGFTVVHNYGGIGTDGRGWRVVNTFKVLQAGDPGSGVNVTVGNGSQRQYYVIVRPNTAINSVQIAAVNQTFAAPGISNPQTNATLSGSGARTGLVFSHGWSFQAISNHTITSGAGSSTAVATGSTFRVFRYGIGNQSTGWVSNPSTSYTTSSSSNQYTGIDLAVLMVS